MAADDGKIEKDAGKEVKGQKEETAKGNCKPTERPRFMFNIADGGFTGSLLHNLLSTAPNFKSSTEVQTLLTQKGGKFDCLDKLLCT